MANKTDPEALPAHGSDPQLLIEGITRERVYESRYWREHCFGISAAGLVALATRLRYAGGTIGPVGTPCPFLCALLKLLQLGPEPEIVDVYLQQEDFKYARLLAAVYTRLVGSPVRVYTALEPLLADYRKVVIRNSNGFALRRMDEVVDDLLEKEDFVSVKLPRLQKRSVLVQTGLLERRVSALPPEDLAGLEELAA